MAGGDARAAVGHHRRAVRAHADRGEALPQHAAPAGGGRRRVEVVPAGQAARTRHVPGPRVDRLGLAAVPRAVAGVEHDAAPGRRRPRAVASRSAGHGPHREARRPAGSTASASTAPRRTPPALRRAARPAGRWRAASRPAGPRSPRRRRRRRPPASSSPMPSAAIPSAKTLRVGQRVPARGRAAGRGQPAVEVDEDRAGQVPRVVRGPAGAAVEVPAHVGEHDVRRVLAPPLAPARPAAAGVTARTPVGGEARLDRDRHLLRDRVERGRCRRTPPPPTIARTARPAATGRAATAAEQPDVGEAVDGRAGCRRARPRGPRAGAYGRLHGLGAAPPPRPGCRRRPTRSCRRRRLPSWRASRAASGSSQVERRGRSGARETVASDRAGRLPAPGRRPARARAEVVVACADQVSGRPGGAGRERHGAQPGQVAGQPGRAARPPPAAPPPGSSRVATSGQCSVNSVGGDQPARLAADGQDRLRLPHGGSVGAAQVARPGAEAQGRRPRGPPGRGDARAGADRAGPASWPTSWCACAAATTGSGPGGTRAPAGTPRRGVEEVGTAAVIATAGAVLVCAVAWDRAFSSCSRRAWL